MNPNAYLIKLAVTVSQLAQVAKANKIPLIGDWRYAAKLLSRQATPAGQAHYQRVVGFTTPLEKLQLQQQLKQLNSPLSLKRIQAERQKDNPELEQFMQAAGEFKGTKNMGYETGFAYSPNAPAKPEIALGYPGSFLLPGMGNKALTVAKQVLSGNLSSVVNPPTHNFTRFIHTHPAFLKSQLAYIPEFRKSVFGHVLPSGTTDTPLWPTEAAEKQVLPHLDKMKTLLREDPNRRPEIEAIGKKMIEPFVTPEGMPVPGSMESPPSNLYSAVDAIKRRLGNSTFAHESDQGLITQPAHRVTSCILAPHTGAESVSKGGYGKLNHIYFRQGEPL